MIRSLPSHLRPPPLTLFWLGNIIIILDIFVHTWPELLRYEHFALFLKSSFSPVVKTTSETKQSVHTLCWTNMSTLSPYCLRNHLVRIGLRSWSEDERIDKYLGPAWPGLTRAADCWVTSGIWHDTRRAGVWKHPDISIYLHKSIICHWPPVIIHYPHPRYKTDMHLPYQFMLISFESYYINITGGQIDRRAEIWW